MLAVLEPGLVTAKDCNNQKSLFAVDSGFVQVQEYDGESKVNVVVKFAWTAEDELEPVPLPSDLDDAYRVRRLNEAKMKVKSGAVRE